MKPYSPTDSDCLPNPSSNEQLPPDNLLRHNQLLNVRKRSKVIFGANFNFSFQIDTVLAALGSGKPSLGPDGDDCVSLSNYFVAAERFVPRRNV